MLKDKRDLIWHLTRFGFILCKVLLMWGHLKALDFVSLIAINLISLTVVKLINLAIVVNLVVSVGYRPMSHQFGISSLEYHCFSTLSACFLEP